MSRSTNNTYSLPTPPRPHLTYREPFDLYFGNFEDDFGEWASGISGSPLYDFQATQVTRTGASDSRRPFEGTLAVARPLGLAGSAAAPGPRVHILVLGNELARQADPRTGQMVGNQWNTAAPGLEADSRLTHNEQKKALQKLKKEIYNPLRRRISQRVNLYYRDIAVKEKEMENDENGKRCPICLDDFEPKQEVMLTPCKHMFHEECIVPWVKSNGRCPDEGKTKAFHGQPRFTAAVEKKGGEGAKARYWECIGFR
ncbi:hypothetical protein C1H46_010654 [Malus baccata]|uniref:RING-type E3 ubiquitin transferase n=1 Tax=Malus baccata TaxID=106549 RepID=A0A540MZC1_MALBA|nr:hypothetical protein C1H46_010654 [Malus baccata]